MNPFVLKKTKQKKKDRIGMVFCTLATYFILLCAFFIFGDIFFKGLPVILKAEPPFINLDFLSKNPETLVVFKDGNGVEQRMDISDYYEEKANNPSFVAREEHTHSYSGGGILGPIVGSALLVFVCIIVALFVGVASAIYLNEYAKQGKVVNWIRLAITNLAGVPSIVFGLFGFAFFCIFPWLPVLTHEVNHEKVAKLFGNELVLQVWPATEAFPSGGFLSFQGWGTSLIAGGLTLAIMVLPVIIAACEESLKAIPKGFREASLALGATKWQCVRTAVLPYAAPGILTASILGVTRVAGETAPIMFTAAVAAKGGLPFTEAEGKGFFWLSDFFTQSVQALPYHIYTVAARIPNSEYTQPMQNGSVFVFMSLVMGFAALSIFLRMYFRKILKW